MSFVIFADNFPNICRQFGHIGVIVYKYVFFSGFVGSSIPGFLHSYFEVRDLLPSPKKVIFCFLTMTRLIGLM